MLPLMRLTLMRLTLMRLMQSRVRPRPPRKAIRFRPMRRLRLTQGCQAAEHWHRSGMISLK
jgi:hypothetical protein